MNFFILLIISLLIYNLPNSFGIQEGSAYFRGCNKFVEDNTNTGFYGYRCEDTYGDFYYKKSWRINKINNTVLVGQDGLGSTAVLLKNCAIIDKYNWYCKMDRKLGTKIYYFCDGENYCKLGVDNTLDYDGSVKQVYSLEYFRGKTIPNFIRNIKNIF